MIRAAGAPDETPRTGPDTADEQRRTEKQRRIYALGMMDLTRAPTNLPAAVGDWKRSWRQIAGLPARRRHVVYAAIASSWILGAGLVVWSIAFHHAG